MATRESVQGWVCYVCKSSKYKVMAISEIAPGFFCTECLFAKIRDGEIDVSVPGAAPTTTTGSVTLPVSTADDGSVTVGDIEIRW